MSMKKRVITVLAVCALCAVSAVIGAYAATEIRDVSAEMRPDFTIVIDGQKREFKNVDGDAVYPLLYDGTTYLPVRAIGELMGKTVYWYENEKKIELKNKDSTVTDADVIVPGGDAAPAATETAQTPTAAPGPSSNAGKTAVTEERAKAIALEKAGLADDSGVRFERIKLEREYGHMVYDVEFCTLDANGRKTMEYDVEIDADTGEIIKWDKERD